MPRPKDRRCYQCQHLIANGYFKTPTIIVYVSPIQFRIIFETMFRPKFKEQLLKILRKNSRSSQKGLHGFPRRLHQRHLTFDANQDTNDLQTRFWLQYTVKLRCYVLRAHNLGKLLAWFFKHDPNFDRSLRDLCA